MNGPAFKTLRLAVFISGGGRTLLNLLDHLQVAPSPGFSAAIELVVASGPCPGVERAQARGLSPRIEPGQIPADRLASLLRDHRIDLVVLAGYLKRLPIVPDYEHRVVNIHPALLPSFGGPGMYGLRVHQAVLDAGCKVSGCTVHLCDAEYDRGPIIVQRTCEVREDDTPQTLAARVFDLECAAYPAAIRLLAANRVVVEGRRARVIPVGVEQRT